MNHLFLAIYLFTLLSSAALLPVLWVKHRAAKAFLETFLILVIQNCLVFLGLGLLYVRTVFSPNHELFSIFLALSILNLGLMVFLIPRQLNKLFDVELPRWARRLVLIGSLVSILSAIGLGFHWMPLNIVFVALPLLGLFAVVIYSQIIYARHHNQASAASTPKFVGMILPVFAIVSGLIEGFVFPENLLDRGVSLSLPLTILLANAMLWHFRQYFFISPQLDVRALSELTQKEMEVVDRVAQGMSNKKIAQDLAISPSTVKNHLYNAYKKLGVSNRYALMKLVEAKEFR